MPLLRAATLPQQVLQLVGSQGLHQPWSSAVLLLQALLCLCFKSIRSTPSPALRCQSPSSSSSMAPGACGFSRWVAQKAPWLGRHLLQMPVLVTTCAPSALQRQQR